MKMTAIFEVVDQGTDLIFGYVKTIFLCWLRWVI